MRWAAGTLLLALACGSASTVPNNGSGDAGSPSTLPPADGGPADAGPGDAGPADAGPPPDCVGLVPSKLGAAYTFDVPYIAGQTCSAATSDGNGVIAAEA